MSKFILDIINVEKDTFVIDHCHITGKINGYAHKNCNSKKQYKNIPLNVYAHNGSKFVHKILCHGVRIADFGFMKLNLVGRSGSNISRFSIDNKIIFKDTMQYYNCSLDALSDTKTKVESQEVRGWAKQALEHGNRYLWLTYLSLENEDKQKIMSLLEKKLLFPYELLITGKEFKELRKKLPDIEIFFSTLKNLTLMKNYMNLYNTFIKSFA